MFLYSVSEFELNLGGHLGFACMQVYKGSWLPQAHGFLTHIPVLCVPDFLRNMGNVGRIAAEGASEPVLDERLISRNQSG